MDPTSFPDLRKQPQCRALRGRGNDAGKRDAASPLWGAQVGQELNREGEPQTRHSNSALKELSDRKSHDLIVKRVKDCPHGLSPTHPNLMPKET